MIPRAIRPDRQPKAFRAAYALVFRRGATERGILAACLQGTSTN